MPSSAVCRVLSWLIVGVGPPLVAARLIGFWVFGMVLLVTVVAWFLWWLGLIFCCRVRWFWSCLVGVGLL